jgi:hypothetical protein
MNIGSLCTSFGKYTYAKQIRGNFLKKLFAVRREAGGSAGRFQSMLAGHGAVCDCAPIGELHPHAQPSAANRPGDAGDLFVLKSLLEVPLLSGASFGPFSGGLASHRATICS